MTLELNRVELFNDGRDTVQPLTIFPISSSREKESLSETDEKSTSYKHWSLRTINGEKPSNKAPEITYHCIYCDQCFVELLSIYDHINNQHADLASGPLEDIVNDSKNIDNDEDIDYSWVLEPICELIDLGEENINDNVNSTLQNTYEKKNSDDSENSDSETDSDDEDDNVIDNDEHNENRNVENNNPKSTNVNNNCSGNEEDSSSTSSTSSSTTTSTSSQDNTNSTKLHLDNTKGNIFLSRTQIPLSSGHDQNASSIISQMHPIMQSTATLPKELYLPKSVELKTNDLCESTSIILLNSKGTNNNNNIYKQSLETLFQANNAAINDINIMNHSLLNMMEFGTDQSNINGINMTNLNMYASSTSPPSQTTHSTLVPSSTTVIRRGRGRKSAAETAAMQLSSLNSNEPKCFQCAHCEASFLSAGDLSKHVRCHITNKPFQCSICEKTFTHIGSLNTHIRIHSGEKPYKCEICTKAFTQSSSLMVHVRSHSIVKPHQCHLCDKGFFNSSSLSVHLKLHQVNEIHSCQECDSTFKHESQLLEHMRTHTQVLLYQCSICQMAYANSSQLVQHMKCHMGEKPFTCSICDRSFTQSGSLNIHMRIHTGEKPFQCKRCDRSFSQASSLSVHMKMHLGEKPFSCNICGKCYSQSTYLNKHLQSHSMDHVQEPHSNIDLSSTKITAETLVVNPLPDETTEQQGAIQYGNVHNYTQLLQPQQQHQKFLVQKSMVIDGNSLSSLSSSSSSSSSSSLSSSSSASSSISATSALSSQQEIPPLQETLLCIACGDLHPDAASLARHVNQQHSALIKNNMKDEGNDNANEYNIIRGEENDNAADHDLHQIRLGPAMEQQQYLQQMQWIMQMQQHFMQNGNFVYPINGLDWQKMLQHSFSNNLHNHKSISINNRKFKKIPALSSNVVKDAVLKDGNNQDEDHDNEDSER